ncbi:FtsX-like permease family protein, partial [Brachybacterium hainanense]
ALDPVAALARHRSIRAGGGTSLPPMIAGAVCGAAALVGGIGSLAVGGGTGAALLVFATLTAILAMVVLAPVLVDAAAGMAGALPVDARLVLRDMARRRSRSLPAICAVLASTLVLALLVVFSGSLIAQRHDVTTRMTEDGGAVLGIHLPLSDGLDQAILGSVTAHLQEQGLITASHPVRSTLSPDAVIPVAMPGPQVPCSPEQAVSVASAITPGAPVDCVAWEDGWQPSLHMPSWLSDGLVVLDPAAMRATGLPGAEEAARLLADGGVLVHDATRLDARGSADPARGTVEIELQRWSGAEVEVLDTQRRPGMFVHGAEGSLTMTAQTAAELGIPLRYVGEVLELPRPLDAAGAQRLETAVAEVSALGWLSAVPRGAVLGGMDRMPAAMLVMLVLVAAFGASASMVLGRQEAREDLRILRAVGASPRRLRAQGLLRAVAVLVLGTLPGVLAGGGIGALLVLWLGRAELGGPWRQIAPMWSALGIGLGAIVLAVLAVSLVAGGPGRRSR